MTQRKVHSENPEKGSHSQHNANAVSSQRTAASGASTSDPGPAGRSRRLRDAGVVLLSCAASGDLASSSLVPGEDWLADLVCASPLFRQGLRDAASKWLRQADPVPIQALPGCWLLPTPRLSRRHRTGYDVAVIFTSTFVDSEQLVAMCQTAATDLTVCRKRLLQLPPAAECDVARFSALIRLSLSDQQQRSSDVRTIDSIGQQLAESYEEINLLYTIIQSMTVVQQPQRFVKVVCDELLATLPYTWIGAQLADDAKSLKRLSGRLIIAGQPPTSIDALQRAAVQLLAEARPATPTVLTPGANPRHAAYAMLGKTVAVQPVSRDNKVLGVLIAGDKRGPDPNVTSIDVKLLGATATHLAIFLENAALYNDLNAMFLGTLEALSASIDAKDRYTRGHSQRVAQLTQELGQAVGLDAEAIGRLHIAGLVHDIGKIGVPEAVLCKAGQLTDEEFAWIRKHPEIGYRILKDIPQLADVLPGVLHHHERWDGRGYPHGLAGEKIPYIARLIALADTFDAMSSDRAYRTALGRDNVLREIACCSGTQFDPDLTAVFVRLDFSGYDRLIKEHRQAEQTSAAQVSDLQQRGKAA